MGAGRLQLETGLEYDQTRVGGSPTNKQLTIQANLRAGIPETLELSLETEPYSWFWGGWGRLSVRFGR